MLAMRYKLFLVLWIGLIGTSCNRSIDPVANQPKAVLTDYVQLTFNIKSYDERNKLSAYLEGDLKTKVQGWTEAEFKEAFIDSKRVFEKMTFTDIKKINEQEYSITYDVVFTEQRKGSPVKVTNHKLVKFLLIDQKWKITEVRSLKELLEYQGELSVL